MLRGLTALVILCAVLPGGAAEKSTILSAEERAEGFQLLFDGKTLAGWDGNPRFWSVEDGAIVGRTTTENPTRGNTFIFWREGLLADFELRLSWKIEGGNSGVQYRSTDLGGWVAGGYQADIDAGGRFTGILYEERGRGILARRGEKVLQSAQGTKKPLGRVAEEKAILEAVRAGRWNDYVIRARGNQLVQILNGVTTVDFTDDQKAKRALSGVLALQLHAGPPMTVRFRSIRLKRFPVDGFEPLFDGRSLTGWKRHEGLPGHGVAGRWYVEDGAIVGVQDPPGRGGFLTTYRTFRDFEVELETRIDWPFDSGVFLRVGPTGRSHQVTLDYREGGDIGSIYIPWGPGFVHRSPAGMKLFTKDEWNKLRISCRGEPARIKVWVNDTPVTDFQHTEKTTAGVPREGTLCLQIHPGGEGYDQSKARFRKIAIREFATGAAGPPDLLAAPVNQPISLFDGTTTAGWKAAQEEFMEGYGAITVDKGTLVLEEGSPMTAAVWTEKFPRENYEVSLEANRLDGFDFFCGMTFPVGESYCTLIVGGWGGSVVGLSNVDDYAADSNETTTVINFENKKWYPIRLRVTAAAIQAWIGGELKIDLKRAGHSFSIWPQQEPVRPFGIATWYTKAGLRAITFKRLAAEK